MGDAITTKDGRTLPTVVFDRLWHVGTFDLAAKRPGSLEGACLSVSRCPAAWREISDGLVTGGCWVADARGIQLLDAHALDPQTRTAILEWGVAEGLAERATMWRASRFDEELDDTVSFMLADRIDAIAELGLDEEDDDYEARIAASLAEVTEHRSTPALDMMTLSRGRSMGDGNLVDLLLPLWTWAATDLTGVWWADRFDPLAYSAPRGGLIPARMDRLKFERSDDEPYDADDAE